MPVGKQHEQRSIGPKSITQALKSLEIVGPPIKPTILEQTSSVIFNTAPRAGQTWKIEGCYFEFPQAIKETFLIEEGQNFEFTIEMLVGGIVTSKQIFLTFCPPNTQERWPLVGNLEAFSPPVVYPGQSIEVKTKLNFQSSSAGGEALLHPGRVVVTYSQTSR